MPQILAPTIPRIDMFSHHISEGRAANLAQFCAYWGRRASEFAAERLLL